jgi:hypothetical protein
MRTSEASKSEPRVKRIAGLLGVPSRSDLGEGRVGIATLDTCDVELPGVREDGMSGRNGSESPEPRAGRLGAPAQRRHRV